MNSNGRYRYEPTTEGKIEVYIGDQYLTTCNSFTEVFRFIMHESSQSA